MDPMEFGSLIFKSTSGGVDTYVVQFSSSNVAKIEVYETEESLINKVIIFKYGLARLEFQDTMDKNSPNKFYRVIGKNKYTIEEGKVQYLESKKIMYFIQKAKAAKAQKDNIMTMDIETYGISDPSSNIGATILIPYCISFYKKDTAKKIKENILTLDIETYSKANLINLGEILIPYCISFYDGVSSKSFYLTDFKNSNDMIIECLKSIFIKDYNKNIIYVHNLAKFDSIFWLNSLADLGIVHPVINKDRLISIKVVAKIDDELITLTFFDSYQLLPSSLANLTKSFNVTLKGSLDHALINSAAELGNLDYYKDEAIKYCELDCVSLFELLIKFNEYIFNMYKVNIVNYPTLPSLSFGIFRSSFIEDNKITQLSGQISKDLRIGYTGGAVDMYIPKGPLLETDQIYVYDVNSLYPYVMANFYMPMPTELMYTHKVQR